MLLARGKITRELIRMMGGWRRSGFNVYCGPRIFPRERKTLENLAAYLTRSSFSQHCHAVECFYLESASPDSDDFYQRGPENQHQNLSDRIDKPSKKIHESVDQANLLSPVLFSRPNLLKSYGKMRT